MPLLSCSNLTLSFGGPPVLDHASFLLDRGERVGLLGRNGEGKSSLLRVLARELDPDTGEIVYSTGVRVARLEQKVPADIHDSVIHVVASGLHRAEQIHEAEKLCSLLDVDPEKPFSDLSGGQRRRALLGKALAGNPDVLLLDEPTNHLDLERIEWLESYLIRLSVGLLFVTHDRTFLQKLATRIIELDRGQLTSWDCNYHTFLVRKEQQLAAEEKQWAEFDKKLAKEEVWIRQGIKARRTRNEGRVRALLRLRQERSERRERSGAVKMATQQAQASGQKVITAENVSFTFPGTTQPIVRDFSGVVMRADKIGLIGPNGSGKTTFLNLLLGRLKPDQGTVKHGTSLEIAFFDQHRHLLDENKSVAWNVAGENDKVIINGRPRHIISYLEDFLFKPDRSRQPVATLSGGERNRVLLARLFTRPSNLLILDEPTNDLDAETLELLEAMLVDYDGTLLVVSHDREFLDNVCSSTFVFEGDGVINEYAGGYSDWQRTLQLRKGPAKEEPSTKSSSGKAAVASNKLNNRERETLKKLPGQIEAYESELTALEARLADPAFYKSGSDEVKTVTVRTRELNALIEDAYMLWGDLEARNK